MRASVSSLGISQNWLGRVGQLLLAPAAFMFATASPATPILEQVSPIPQSYVFGAGADFTQNDTPFADVTSYLFAVDLVLPPGAAVNTSTSGCEASDFVGFIAGSIALMQRGTCLFEHKLANAAAAGAVGALIFNEGQPGRTDAINVTASGTSTIPWFFTSFNVGSELALLLNSGPVVARIRTEAVVPEPSTWAMMLIGFGAVGLAMRRRRKEGSPKLA